MSNDGMITIGVEVDTKQLKNDLKIAKQELKKYEKEAQDILEEKKQYEIDTEQTRQKIQKLNAEIKELNASIENSNNKTGANYVLTNRKITELLETRKQLEESINSEEQKYNDRLDEAYRKINMTNDKIQNISLKTNKISQNKEIVKMAESVNKSLTKTINRVTGWALALFGVRSAYSFIRSSLSVIASQDEQLQADIDYMKNALAYTIEPIVRAIVDLAKQLMFYIGYVVRALTGKNIFENANKSLKNATSNAKGLNKELNKTLASFDEVNILQNPSSSGAGGGAGVTTPSFDLSNLDNVQVPSWLQWMIDHKDDILGVLLGIATGLLAIKAGLDPLTSAGIALIVIGVYEALKNLLDFIENPTFKNFTGMLEGIAIAVLGVGLAFGTWPLVVAGVLALVTIEIVKHFDEITDLFDKLREWLDKNFLTKLRELFGPVGDLIYYPIKLAIEWILQTFENLYGGIKKIVDGIVMIFQGDFKGGIENVFSGIKDIMYAPLKAFYNAVIEIAPKIYGAFKEIGNKIGEILSSAFTRVINYALDRAENTLNTPISSINNLLDTINEVPGINIGKLSKIYLPRLAKGTIASVPGRGIPTPNGIFAEAGREAYLPLSDTQLLEELGSTIGRYITINNYVTNKMDSRTISRELQVTKNESDFAYNR